MDVVFLHVLPRGLLGFAEVVYPALAFVSCDLLVCESLGKLVRLVYPERVVVHFEVQCGER